MAFQHDKQADLQEALDRLEAQQTDKLNQILGKTQRSYDPPFSSYELLYVQIVS